MTVTIKLAHLYPKRMNIYGDRGNIMTLARRCQWRDIGFEVDQIEVGERLDVADYDMFFFGGGQDIEQYTVAKDLAGKAELLQEAHVSGAVFLAVCGGYQLLGRSYKPNESDELTGAGIFPVVTVAGPDRLIGNVVGSPAIAELEDQPLVGFENHSGLTTLDEGAQPLATLRHGRGNNGTDNTEGCVAGNAIGTYLHGALLPKNPPLADWLINKAVSRKQPAAVLQPLPDVFEQAANMQIATRFV